MSDGRTLRDHLIEVCVSVKKVFNTKVRATPAKVKPMKLEVDDSVWEDPANARQLNKQKLENKSTK